MLLGKLLKSIEKKYKYLSVNGISFDSREVKKGNIFFSIRGKKISGSRFIKNVILRGASAIVVEKKPKIKNCKIPIIIVKNSRKSLAEACSNFYSKKPKNIIAVTGTNGKSSVANFFYQILNLNKVAVASIGTLGISSKSYNKKTKLTSMDPLFLNKNLKILKKNKINNVILEASSHGLEQKRLDNLKIKVGIFTNFSHDHLDYHKNMKSYFNSKMYLFNKLLEKKSTIITDEENLEFKVIKKISKKRGIKIISIGKNSGKIKVLNHKYKMRKQVIKISINSKVFILEIPLIGYFQVKNLLMSVLAAHCCGLSFKKILNKINKIKPVPGRLESVVRLKNNSNIIVDFAHTPDALKESLIALKKQFKKKIIIVFGCGGDRDIKKRFVMGKIAKKYCRKVFITDDNPRYESPKKIRNEIIKGCGNNAINIGDRKKAIKEAIHELNPNEILLIAGKGHEDSQDYGRKILKFSDKKIIKEIVFNNKFSNQNFTLKNVFPNLNIESVKYNGVSINTKTIKKNNLFFAIKGKNNDGHDFVEEALNKGAIRSIISKKIKKFPRNKIIKVKDTFLALKDLAKSTRAHSSAKIIGITGSVGKTTLKNLVSFSLKNYGKVYHSPFSYNNKFGVSVSLSSLKQNVDYGVFEIGMDKKGEIDSLSKIVKPEIGVINNISEAHLKNFNSLKDIAKAKSEIIDNILEDGTIVLNKDSNYYNFLLSKAAKRKINIISYSSKKKADIFLLGFKKIKNYYELKINVKSNIFYFNIKHPTKNMINNILACISILYTLSLDLKIMHKEFINFSLPKGRGDVKEVEKFNKKFKFIDESYNANPLSMRSAISNMNYYQKKGHGRKLVLLGDMLELGTRSKILHRSLSTIINKSKIDKVFVYGKHIKETFKFLYKTKQGKEFNSLEEAYKYFSKILHNNDILMVKGSNATGLNQFSKSIKKG